MHLILLDIYVTSTPDSISDHYTLRVSLLEPAAEMDIAHNFKTPLVCEGL